MPVDLRCYVITSGVAPHVVDVAARAARAGAGVVQVRAKEVTTREFLQFTTTVADAVQHANSSTRVVVNDRVDVALAARDAGAFVHGVHLGQDDMPPTQARKILGDSALIGLTTGTLKLVQKAEEQFDVLDYIGAGPFRETPTKSSGRPPLGVAGYPPLVSATRLPVVAIGDVTMPDVPALVRTGVSGTALVRGVMHADSPETVVSSILREFEMK